MLLSHDTFYYTLPVFTFVSATLPCADSASLLSLPCWLERMVRELLRLQESNWNSLHGVWVLWRSSRWCSSGSIIGDYTILCYAIYNISSVVWCFKKMLHRFFLNWMVSPLCKHGISLMFWPIYLPYLQVNNDDELAFLTQEATVPSLTSSVIRFNRFVNSYLSTYLFTLLLRLKNSIRGCCLHKKFLCNFCNHDINHIFF